MSIMPEATLPAPPACPSWCAVHDAAREWDGSVLHVHAGAPLDRDGRVRLRQSVYVEPGGRLSVEPAAVVLDGDEVPLPEARRLVAALAWACTMVDAVPSRKD